MQASAKSNRGVAAAAAKLENLKNRLRPIKKKACDKENPAEYLYSTTLHDAADALCDMKADDDGLEAPKGVGNRGKTLQASKVI